MAYLFRNFKDFSNLLKGLFHNRTPGQLVIQLTDRCNGLCPQCGMRATENFTRSRLSNDNVKKIIDAAAERGVNVLSFTGGEPLLLLDDLAQMITYAGKAGIEYIRTGTNGYVFANPQHPDFTSRVTRIAHTLADTPLRNFWISIDSAIPSFHESMRGFPGLIKGIKAALPILHDAGIYPTANLGINRNIGGTLTQSIMHGEPEEGPEGLSDFLMAYTNAFAEFYRFVIDLGFTLVNVCYPMSVESNPSEDGLNPVYAAHSTESLITFSWEEKRDLFRALFDTIPEFRSKIRIFTPRTSLYTLQTDNQAEDRKSYPCRGGLDYFYIAASDGNTYPCGYRGEESLGKFWDLNMKDCSTDYACRKCEWECFRDPSELFGPLLHFISNPVALTRKLKKDAPYRRIWFSDIKYCRACGLFDGRKPPDFLKMQRSSKKDLDTCPDLWSHAPGGRMIRQPLERGGVRVHDIHHQHHLASEIDMEGLRNSPLLRVFPFAEQALEHLMVLPKLNNVYREILQREGEDHFLQKALGVLNIKYDLSQEDLEKIPTQGPTIVVANHPFGGIDGILLSSIILSRRRDVRVMANYFLCSIPELRPILIPVDPFGQSSSVRSNLASIRETVQFLKAGGLVCIFPAGEVSHIHLRKRRIVDPQWSTIIARIVRKTQASVLPAFFSGFNSITFQLLGLLHPRLRTVMLPRELLRKANTKIALKIGRLIPYERLERYQTDQDITEYLRIMTYMLANRKPSVKRLEKPKKTSVAMRNTTQPIPPPHPAVFLEKEVQALSHRHLLVESERFAVYLAESKEIPYLMQDIGRLREVTFREVQEGTGKPLDIDRFDSYYMHLFLWSKEDCKVAGGYRLGMTDKIVEMFGPRGLYTHTLFEYDMRFISRISPAIELGRSFVSAEYQKTFQPLMLLWKAIAVFVSRNPQYKILFGPVSINSSYRSISRQIMIEFLRENNNLDSMAKLIKPRNPMKKTPMRPKHLQATVNVLHDLQALSEMVSDIEGGQKGIPILLKQYLRYGGKLLGFNLDHNFGNVLDGLIVADLTKTDPKVLARYMGKDGLEAFLRYHNYNELARCA